MNNKKTKKIIGYKAFDKNFKCQNYQFEVGKTYEHESEIKLCSSGFHFCKYPLSVFNYYNITDNIKFAEIETELIDDVEEKYDDNDINQEKLVTEKIKIKKELSLSELIKAQIDFIFEFCFKFNSSKKSSGDSSQLASTGYSSQLASSGDYSKLASSGDYSQLASSGYSSQLASSGDSSQLASSGNYSQLASSGYSSQLASSGYYSKLASSGNYSQLESSGKNSIISCIGNDSKAKAKKGSWIVLAEWKTIDNEYKPVAVLSKQVDGIEIKEDVFYKLKNGKFVEEKQ